ncbi:hypothetical protein M378DRAFT_17714 [Amanita muscaria Koide BX008]|uniref:Uncharacterized protein n=1 Tax=Amanita muscaria (strain Koide BX008) TaxID=946122 RepID=A0A0C2SNX7_AMAMK|nr:hypothetical protein M378DRAFT_17714 [Amanita muscaria Koide BX008]
MAASVAACLETAMASNHHGSISLHHQLKWDSMTGTPLEKLHRLDDGRGYIFFPMNILPRNTAPIGAHIVPEEVMGWACHYKLVVWKDAGWVVDRGVWVRKRNVEHTRYRKWRKARREFLKKYLQD